MYKEITEILKKEQQRQDSTIELIASENYASQAVMDLCGSVFTNKYAEGYPGKRYYNGCDHMDEIEQLAIDNVCDLYECEYANYITLDLSIEFAIFDYLTWNSYLLRFL